MNQPIETLVTPNVKTKPNARPRLQSMKKALSRLFQNKFGVLGGLFLLLLVILAVFAPWLAPYNPVKQDYMSVLQPPSAKHWFGTDALGRDILSRIIYGAQVSLKAGIILKGSGMKSLSCASQMPCYLFRP